MDCLIAVSSVFFHLRAKRGYDVSGCCVFIIIRYVVVDISIESDRGYGLGGGGRGVACGDVLHMVVGHVSRRL